LKTKYKALQKQVGRSNSGTSTPAHGNMSEGNRSVVNSVQKTIGEQAEDDGEAVGSQAKEDLGLFNQGLIDSAGLFDSQFSPGTSPVGQQPTFTIDDNILDPVFTGFAVFRSQESFISDGSVGKRYGPVTAEKMQEIEQAMVRLSQYWASKKPMRQSDSRVVEPGQPNEIEQTPEDDNNTLASILAQKDEEIQSLEARNQSSNELVVQLIKASKSLVKKILGERATESLDGCTFSVVGEGIADLFAKELVPLFEKHSELVRTMTAMNAELQTNLTSLQEAHTSLQHAHSKLETSYSHLENKYSELSKSYSRSQDLLNSVLQNLSISREKSSFRSQDPIRLINSITGSLGIEDFPVDLWKGGLTTGFAHVIKDLLRRITRIVFDLHQVAPRRNKAWIEALLNILSSVEEGVDNQLKGFKSAGSVQPLESYLQDLQTIVASQGSQA